jgi:hypothetical protein
MFIPPAIKILAWFRVMADKLIVFKRNCLTDIIVVIVNEALL